MFKDDLLKGQTIIVTGGGTGLGKAMAARFSELGANIVIASRRMEVLEATAKEITEQSGNSVLPVQLDVREPENIEAMIQKTVDEFGQVNALLNNAAGNFISPTERLSYNAFDTVVDIVLRGTYYCTLALGKYWIKNNVPATVLNIVTTYAFTGSGYVVPSAVAKAGVLNMTRSLAAEWGKYNIRMNAIAPGPFPTKGAWDRLVPDPKLQEKLINRIPMKRLGKHPELANLAAFLMSEFSSYMTGEVVTIDGGEWLSGAGEFNFLEMVKPEEWDFIEKQIRDKSK